MSAISAETRRRWVEAARFWPLWAFEPLPETEEYESVGTEPEEMLAEDLVVDHEEVVFTSSAIGETEERVELAATNIDVMSDLQLLEDVHQVADARNSGSKVDEFSCEEFLRDLAAHGRELETLFVKFGEDISVILDA